MGKDNRIHQESQNKTPVSKPVQTEQAGLETAVV